MNDVSLGPYRFNSCFFLIQSSLLEWPSLGCPCFSIEWMVDLSILTPNSGFIHCEKFVGGQGNFKIVCCPDIYYKFMGNMWYTCSFRCQPILIL